MATSGQIAPGRSRRDRGSRAPARRRRLALAAAAGLAFVGGCALGSQPPAGEGGGPGEAGEPATEAALEQPPAACAGSLREAAGQKLMVRMEDAATPPLRAAAREGSIGGVILFPTSPEPSRALAAEVSALQRAAASGDRPPLLVATDQEGGPVERFAGPPDVSPVELAASGDEAAARREGEATGELLAGLGANMDLAPVLDLALAGGALESRSFGAEPARVTKLAGGFAAGLEQAGVTPVLKHFPGLGRALGNTDLEPVAIEAGAAQLEAGIEPFRSAIEAGAPAVMVANAIYPALGPERPAVLAREVVTGLLRERLGFEGVVLSDDLLAGAIASQRAPEQAALEASEAGVDVLLYAAAPVEADPIARRLAAATQSGALSEPELRESCARIVALKQG